MILGAVVIMVLTPIMVHAFFIGTKILKTKILMAPLLKRKWFEYYCSDYSDGLIKWLWLDRPWFLVTRLVTHRVKFQYLCSFKAYLYKIMTKSTKCHKNFFIWYFKTTISFKFIVGLFDKVFKEIGQFNFGAEISKRWVVPDGTGEILTNNKKDMNYIWTLSYQSVASKHLMKIK